MGSPTAPSEPAHADLDWVLRCYQELTRSRDIIALHILARLYKGDTCPYVLNSLVKELRFITRSKTSVYNKCRKLDEMGLLRLVRGYPCLILPREDVAGAVVWKIVDAADRKLGISRERATYG